MNKTIQTTQGRAHAQYAIIDVGALTTLVNDHITTCRLCGASDIYFSVEQYNGLSSFCQVVCPSCDVARDSNVRKKNRLQSTLDTSTLTTKIRKQTLRRLRLLEKSSSTLLMV